MPAIETIKIWCAQYNLEEEIKKHMDNGWSVMYVVAVWQPPMNNAQFCNAPTQYVTLGADGSQTFHIPVPPPSSATPPVLEICLYKRDYKSDPCPRCSYPFPNEEDIGRDS